MILVFLLVATLAFGSAKDQSFTIHYNFDEGGYFERTVDYNSAMMKITTDNRTICRYSMDSGDSYSIMSNLFDVNGGTSHEKSFYDLEDGTYYYYIKCKVDDNDPDPEEFEVALRVNSLISAKIHLDKSEPINDNELEVGVETSKYVSSIPIVQYSFNGVSYNDLVVTGAGMSWIGKIVMPDNLEEGVLSFKFRANDLEGRLGTDVVEGAYFSYDFVEPRLVAEIKAISKEGRIELDWEPVEDASDYRIYRSELSNEDYMDYYEETDDTDFVDTSVEDGTTYYYRVSAVDDAGNEGSMSREVEGISLFDDADLNSGLNPQLRGKVDSFLSEIDNLVERVDAVGGFSESEDMLFKLLGLDKEIENAKKEIESIRISSLNLKDQDLTREDLEKKIESSRVRLGVIEKGVPEYLTILDEKKRREELSEEKQRKSILEIDEVISEKDLEKSMKETAAILKETPLVVESEFYNVEVLNLDSSSKKFSIVKRSLNSKLEGIEDAYFMEVLDSSIAEGIEVNNRNYNLVSDNVISFATDTKAISYVLSKVTNFADLEEIEFSFIKVVKEDSDSGSITGFSVFNSSSQGYLGIFGAILLVVLIIYFVYFRNGSLSDDYFRATNRITEAQDLLDSGEIKKAKEMYSKVKMSYARLAGKERNQLYSKTEHLYNGILISEIEAGLEKFRKTKDAVLFGKLEKQFNLLSPSVKERILPLFEQVKGDFKNGK